MADFPNDIFVREPMLDGISEIRASTFNDMYDEVEAIETTLGAENGTYGSPRGSMADLRTRLDAMFSDSGRQKRKVQTYYHYTHSIIDDFRGQVRQYIQVGRYPLTGNITNLTAQPITVNFFPSGSGLYYSTAPKAIHLQVCHQTAFGAGQTTDAENVRAMVNAGWGTILHSHSMPESGALRARRSLAPIPPNISTSGGCLLVAT